MKVFYFLLIPLFIFAQNPDYPDTLFLKSAKDYPCLVNGINSNIVRIIYQDNVESSTALKMVEKIHIGPMGSIYTAETGFSATLDSIEEFLMKRNEALQIEAKDISESKPKTKHKNAWSFGVFYVPTYSKVRYMMLNIYDPYDPFGRYVLQTIAIAYEESLIEGKFSYLLSPKVRLIFDISYNSTYVKTRNERHQSAGFRDPSYDSGDENIDDMKTFELNFGIKYYFAEFLTNKVRAFIQAGIGKQFAFVNDKEKYWFNVSASQTDMEDNENEYLEDINSPFLFHLGFGTEYFFNESLSLFAAIRFYYSKISGTYNYRKINYDNTETQKIDYEKSELLNRIGLGLNFYF